MPVVSMYFCGVIFGKKKYWNVLTLRKRELTDNEVFRIKTDGGYFAPYSAEV